MKKYFTKYLPVEGEIQQDNFFLTPDGRISQCKDVLESLPQTIVNYNGESWKEDELKRFKLFLCSRDIQVGDNVQFQLTKHSPWQELKCIDTIPEQNTVILEGDEFTHHTSADGLNQCFKIIGEISPEAAKWVKEGDEFEESEIKIWKTTRSVSSKRITEAMGGEWKHEKDQIITPGKIHHIKIKCPHCGTFT